MRALLLGLVGLIACARAQPEARKLVNPTPEEAAAFGTEVAKHIAPCDAAALDRSTDREMLIERAVANRHLTDDFIRGFKSTFGGIGTLLCPQLSVQRNLVASFLRVKTVNGAPRPLIRIVLDGALNYYELDLDKQAGRVRAVDLTIYMAGEPLSALVGKMLDTIKGEGDKTATALTSVSSHMLAREWKEAHASLLSLPAKLRETKAMRLMEVQITAQLGDEAYRQAIDVFAKAFPNDPSLALVEIDHAILLKRYGDALRHIDALDTIVGGDPYLDVLRSNVASQQGKSAEALELATRASERAPELAACWWQLLTQQAANKRWDDARRTLATLRDKFGKDVSRATLANDERFKELAATLD